MASPQTTQDVLVEKLVDVRRTSLVVQGGRVFSFSALVVVGDGAGRIGIGLAKAKEVPIAIQKSTERARRDMSLIELHEGRTLQHEVRARHGASVVIMLPASEGTGIIAGTAVRAVFEVLGVRDVLSKCVGSFNPINVVRAVVSGLRGMSTPEQVAIRRGIPLETLLLQAGREGSE